MLNRTILMVLLIFSVSIQASMQARSLSEDFQIRRFGLESGLSQNSINQLQIDRFGYLWVGTFYGLQRFNGTRFESIKLPVADPLEQLSIERITGLSIDREGDLWVATQDGGIATLSLRDQQVGVLQPLWRLCLDCNNPEFWPKADGRMLITTASGVWEGTGKSFQKIDIPGCRLRRCASFQIEQLVVADADQILEFDRTLQLSETQKNDQCTGVSSIAVSGSSVWLGSRALCRYHPKRRSEALVEFGLDVSDLFAEASNSVWGVLSTGELFNYRTMGMANRGAAKRDSELRRWQSAEPMRFRKLLIDPHGQIWIGSDGNGLLRLTPKRVRYLGNELTSLRGPKVALAIDDQGVGYVGGICTPVVESDGTLVPIQFAQSGEPCTYAIYPENGPFGSGLWIGTGGKATLHFASDQGTRNFPQQSANSAHPIRAFLRDENQTLFAAGEAGLQRLEGEQFRIDASFPTEAIFTLGLLADGKMYAGSANGLWIREGELWRQVLNARNVRSVLYDTELQDYWIGTYGDGLFHTSDMQHFRSLTPASGLPESIVSCLLKDALGRLWWSANLGIYAAPLSQLRSKVSALGDAIGSQDRAALKVLIVDRSSGMREPETNGGGQHSCLQAPDGNFWFATVDGVAVLNPEDFMPETARASTRIVAAVLNGVAVDPSKRVRITDRNAALSIEFEDLNLQAHDRTRYRYRLIGGEQQSAWRNAGADRQLLLTNLPYGQYQLEVQSLAAPDEPESMSASLQIDHVKPWHLQPLFWLTAGFSVLATVMLFRRWLSKRDAAIARSLTSRLSEDEQTELIRLRKIEAAKLSWLSGEASESLLSGEANEYGLSGEASGPQFGNPTEDSSLSAVLNRVIDRNLFDPEFDLEKLARTLGLELVELQRLCRDKLQISPIDYVRNRRLGHAKSLLERAAGSITDIAKQCGFGSTSHFSAAFRDRFGVLPNVILRQTITREHTD